MTSDLREETPQSDAFVVKRFLQETLYLPVTDVEELRVLTLEELQAVKDGVMQIARERVSRSEAGKETSAMEKTN